MAKFIILFCFIFSLHANAANYKGIEYTLEPIYGYQKLELEKPYKHVAWQYFYGARITGGYKVFNLEGMYTKSEVDEVFTETNETTRDIVEKLKLGFSTGKTLNNWSLGVLRIGVEGKRIEHQSIINSIKTSTKVDSYRPYLGLGFEIYLKQYVAISLGATAIFGGLPDDPWDNDYEYTSGIKLLY